MIRSLYYKPWLILLSLLSIMEGMAQNGAVIKAAVDKSKILIGEPMVLTVEVKFPQGTAVQFPVIDSIAHFEISKTAPLDSATDNGTVTLKGVYTITSFDSGRWMIPPFYLTKNVKTDSIPVDVVFSDFNPNQDYHDIKDIIEVTPSKKQNWWWYAAGGLLLLIVILYFLLRKKKPITEIQVKTIADPYKTAMTSLDQLAHSKPAAKEYYSSLVDIFKLYVFQKKGILSLQKTTDDLVLQLKDIGLDKTKFDKLSQSLRLSDFVKFARFIPGTEDDKIVFETIKESIGDIEKLN